MPELKYDVAISFLSQDLPTARALNDALVPHARVFLYERQQEEVAGTDGMETFREVFLHESTLNVVLYRDGYGGTKWTRIERDAIQEKALNDGWHTLLLIAIEAGTKAPIWFPPQRIFSSVAESGIPGIAAVVLARAREAGSPDRTETPVELAERLGHKAEEEGRRRKIEHSEAGFKAVVEEIRLVFDRIEAAVTEIAARTPGRRAESGRAQPPHLVAVIGRASVSVNWSFTYINSIEGAALVARYFNDPIPLPGKYRGYLRNPEEDAKRDFLPSLDAGDRWVWTDEKSREVFSSDRLADLLVTETVKRSYTGRDR